ncbi:MAG: hypothetical protein HOC20_03280 [Chloroflexi bacterium]|jgi:Tol biopolymer transport system component|nr:hypothetical protein [Chloroflexota bacterium]
MIKCTLVLLLVLSILFTGCDNEETRGPATAQPTKEPPAPIPEGILIKEVPADAHIIFSSIRYVLDDMACLDDDYELKDKFIQDADCNRLVYHPEDGLAASRQLFTMDIETGEAVQITNTDCFFVSGQVVDSTTIMTNAICADTNADGKINEQDNPNLYLIDLITGDMNCLTCELGLQAINNPDYSPVNEKIVLSAQRDSVFHNYLFTIDANKNLEQITNDTDDMDFDCAWSEDGGKIVFSRMPVPAFTKPSQIWLMNADGSDLKQITDGGPNPNNEEPKGVFQIGLDADPDLSPDNTKIVFSRLKTDTENVPIGVWELIIIDVNTKEETVLDSSYANMVPEWKSSGILFTRQIGGTDPMKVQQVLYRFKDGEFEPLEEFPYNVFPIGAFGGSWIELE